MTATTAKSEAELSRSGVHDFQDLQDMRWYVQAIGPKTPDGVVLRHRAPAWIWKYRITDNLLNHPGEYYPNTKTLAELLADKDLLPESGWSAYISINQNQRGMIEKLVGKVPRPATNNQYFESIGVNIAQPSTI